MAATPVGSFGRARKVTCLGSRTGGRTNSVEKEQAMNTIRIIITNADGMVLDSAMLSTADETNAIAYRIIKGEIEARPEEAVLVLGPCQRKFQEHTPAEVESGMLCS